ncbi:MAG: DUF2029 domain-containing protein [Acidobacteria bacterium]|nr:DUF2029 domain-containing protein [Acidobacteriota bacterium]
MLRRILPPLVIGLLALAGFQSRIRHEMVDFGVYRQAAVRAERAEPLYRSTDGHYQFKYLPAFAMLTLPLAMVDAEGGKVMWFALSVGALVLLVRWSARFLPERRRGLPLIIGLTLLFMLKFYVHELVLGQANLFFGVLVLATVAAIQMELPAVAGVLIGAAVCVKPYGLLFAPWLIVTQGRRAAAAFAITFLIALAAPMLLYGFGGNLTLLGDWWRTVTESTAPNLLGNDNVSFAAMWAKWIGPGTAASVLAGLTSLGGVALVAAAWRRRAGINEPEYLEAAALLLLVPLLSPQGWDYVLLLGTPAVALLIDRAPEVPRDIRIGTWIFLGIMGLVSFDLIGRAAYSQFMSWSIVTVCAVFTLLALVRVRRMGLA